MQTDYVQRFLFENLDIRGRLVCLTGAWKQMLEGRGYPEDIVSLLGHTTALNVLLGANQKGAGRVTLQVQGSGPVKLLVSDCTAELRIRGMAHYDPDGWNRVQHFANTLTLDDTRGAQPYDLLTRVFPEELMRVFRLYAVEYHCPYDEDKVKDMLRGLGRQEVESILAERGEVVIRNEMCNHEYRFDADAIARLFATH